MTREGGNVEEWELECADNLDDAFENTDEGERWVDSGAADSNPVVRSAPYNWRRQRDMSPLEGALREAEMEERIGDGRSGSESSSDTTANDERRETAIHGHPQTGGDKFHAMEDEIDEGQSYFYDEDMTRPHDNPNAETREHSRSDADLIFRGPSTVYRTSKDRFLRYALVALTAFGLGILLGTLIDMAVSSCPPNPSETTPSFSSLFHTTPVTETTSNNTIK